MRYLDPAPFLASGIAVTPFRTPAAGIWQTAREISALWALMTLGPLALAEQLSGLAAAAGRAG
jgi:hypothetical protein